MISSSLALQPCPEAAGRPVQSPAAALHDRRLSQVFLKDRKADGRFWYSVVTTGIYCRPSCPSRRARPEHIRFHDSLADARRTGFRACRRCNPEQPSLHDRQRELVTAACRLMEASGRSMSSRELAAALGVSAAHLHRLFRRETGITPRAYSLRSSLAEP